jgi:class 3 adenylate cyclase
MSSADNFGDRTLKKNDQRRRLVALMFTDIVGYTSLMARNEALAFELLEEHRRLFRKTFPEFGGHENKTVGDAFFIEFPSVVEAVRCAIEIQTRFFERNASAANAKKVQVRIGIHLADVIDSNHDSYGDGVNIAARIEGLADAGGICISQQVYDQIWQDQAIKTSKIGVQRLKNIKLPIMIHRVDLPWNARIGRRNHWDIGRAFKWSTAMSGIKRVGSGGALFFVVAFILLLVLLEMSLGYLQGEERSLQEYTLDSSAEPLAPVGDRGTVIDFLETEWSYSVENQHGKEIWKSFDIKNSWRHSDQLVGRVRLKTNFRLTGKPIRPAIILGRVAGVHRAYINGTFIGGSNHLANVSYYAFDRSLLRDYEANELLVVAQSEKSLTPGITPLFELGCFLGEFNEIYQRISRNNLNFHLLNSIYLSISVLLCGICFMFYYFQRKRREYLYFGIFLLLGCVSLSYYNIFLATFLDFRLHRFVKMFGLTTSSFVLLTNYLYLTRRWKFEHFNNAFIIAAVLAQSIWIFFGRDNASNFMQNYNAILMFSTIYSLVWASIATFEWVGQFQKNFRSLKINEQGIRQWYQMVVIAFGFLTAIMIFNSIRGHDDLLPLSESARVVLKDIGFIYPFLFSLFLLIAGSYDYSKKISWMSYRKERADLLLDLVPVMENEKDALEAIAHIQDKVSRFVKATRSSVYLLKSDGAKECFQLSSYFGSHVTRRATKGEISIEGGILGYAFSSRSALLIKDMARDQRFKGRLQEREADGETYASGSCMILPLLIRGKFVGVMTVSDREGGAAFTQIEFALMRVIAKDIAAIIVAYQFEGVIAPEIKKAG